MKYTKAQLDLIVTNIYNQISKPIELENKEIIDKQEIEEDELLTDLKLYNQYQDTINSLYKQKDLILKKHLGDNCKFFTTNNGMSNYILKLKKEKAILKKCPSKLEIEYELLINSDKDIQKIIDAILKKYTK